MTEARTPSLSRRPAWQSSRIRDAGLEYLPAVEVGEEALKVIDGLGLLARFQAGDRRVQSEELRPPRRQLGCERSRLGHVGAIAAVGPLPQAIDRNAFGRSGVGRIDQA